MSSEDMLKLFEEVESVYQNEGSVVPKDKIYDINKRYEGEICTSENNQIKSESQKYKCKNHGAIFKIFVHAFNKFALAKFLYPSLKSAFDILHFI